MFVGVDSDHLWFCIVYADIGGLDFVGSFVSCTVMILGGVMCASCFYPLYLLLMLFMLIAFVFA